MTTTKLSYAKWLREVDRLILMLAGVGADDIAGEYRRWYKAGLTPRKAANRAVSLVPKN